MPEAITEGGIQFIFQNNPKWYKTIRLCVWNQAGRWPWVNYKTVLEDWKNNNETIINDKQEILNTF